MEYFERRFHDGRNIKILNKVIKDIYLSQLFYRRAITSLCPKSAKKITLKMSQLMIKYL